MAAIDALLAARRWPASRVVVLLPHPRLAAQARQAWSATHAHGLVPRFATPRQWAETLMPWSGSPEDLSRDPARDALVAEGWLDRVLGAGTEPGLRRELVARLVDTAGQLAPLAAARPPAERQAWADAAREALGPPGVGHARWESLVSHVALAWVGACGFDTDVLWSPLAQADADALVLLPGHQSDPLAEALCRARGEQGEVLDWGPAEAPAPNARVLRCADFEHEALSAAACVLGHLNAGRAPVALIANDRLLTRRVSALLHEAGVRLRDEAGWKLSTTQAGAGLMALLRAAAPRASTDDVLDWLKLAPAFDAGAVRALERELRRLGIALWSAVPEALRPEGVDALLKGLQAPRPLVQWLRDTDAALALSGQRAALQADAAGAQLLRVLRLGDAAHEFEGLGEAAAAGGDTPRRPRWRPARFNAWVREVLEGAGFQPAVQGEAQVVVLPLAHRLGRAFAAVVAPGCDERHLPASPDPVGTWTREQREALGLPDREALRAAADSAWASLLDGTPLDVLWREHDNGDPLLPSPCAEQLPIAPADAALPPRELAPAGTAAPRPCAPTLVPERVSASAYEDLRRCPYRFFALRQLRLAEADELDTEADARDLGNWLHDVLHAFHAERRDARPGEAADREALDRLAESVAHSQGLTLEHGASGFLPYRAQWPALREGYLRWLYAHEAQGHRFVEAEAAHEARVGRWRLYGRLDRIDHAADGTPVLIDYKTESRQRTEARIRVPFEDTQLAFYAALIDAPVLRAGYLSLTDARNGEPALLLEPDDLAAARDALLQGLASDLDRIAAGAPLPALGEGAACEHCGARGLCRKDFLA
ncbi:PD-(D/E)XK nuclease family protein [Hydrogenophaga sp.]|uniref:PD-(D/E)XK nuclease family protein n=1 Tax=Hydrogenophaga sp. TaxID=1904254 RepID=UPI00257C676D|nr:PD-(D/E)XK nuclease family protein [Hydrogenophaga sp.]